MRVTPEKLERLIEQDLLLVTLDQHRFQRGTKVFAPVDTDRLDRFQRRDHLGRSDRQPRLAQHPREMKDIFRQMRAPEELSIGHSNGPCQTRASTAVCASVCAWATSCAAI